MDTQLLTLGRLAVLVDGVERDSFLTQPLRIGVLLYLALERETTREATMAVFWPERRPDAARHALSQMLHKLRRELGEDCIEARGERLRVAPWITADADRFESAVRRGEWTAALHLYRGPFLEGWHLVDIHGFEDWVDRRRARLSRLHRDAALRFIGERVSAGDLERAIVAARRWAAMATLETEPQRTLVELLARHGRVSEAIRACEEHARQMAAADLDPAPEIVALAEELSAHVPTEPLLPDLPPPAASPASVLPHAPQPRSRLARRTRWLLGLSLATLATVLVLAGRPMLHAGERRSAADRVLVLPLHNLTGDPALDRLGTMGADWIVEGLSRVGVIRVVPLMDVLRAGGADGGGNAARSEGVWARELAAGVLAGTVVTGSVGRAGDSLFFQAQVMAASDGTLLGTVGPEYGTSDAPLGAIDALRQGIMGIVAVRFDPRWSRSHADLDSRIPPPRYDAYLAYADGLEALLEQDDRRAIPRLLRAVELDSSFTRPLLLAATAYRNLGEYEHADSLVAVLGARAEHLTPYEAGALDWQRAKLRADAEWLLRTAERAVNLFPGTAAHYSVAVDALELNHPRLALRFFERLDPERGWLREYFPLWDAMASAHHALGAHRDELRVARQARERLPASVCPLRTEVRALAALGRVADVDDAIGRSLDLPPHADCSAGDVMLTAALELRAHGRSHEARAVTTRAIVWYRSRPAEEVLGEAYQAALTRALALAGRLGEADSLSRSLSAEFPKDIGYLGEVGVLAARRGDATEARRIDGLLAGWEGRYLYGEHTAWRARIAAVLGERDRAVALLHDAFAHGYPWSVELHADPDLQPLADYPPFRRLLEPKG